MKNKIVINGYIIMIGENIGGNIITEEEYNMLLEKIKLRPVPEAGYDYILNDSTVEWELIKLPDSVPVEEEASSEDYEQALQEMGVDFNDEN